MTDIQVVSDYIEQFSFLFVWFGAITSFTLGFIAGVIR